MSSFLEFVIFGFVDVLRWPKFKILKIVNHYIEGYQHFYSIDKKIQNTSASTVAFITNNNGKRNFMFLVFLRFIMIIPRALLLESTLGESMKTIPV